MSNKTDLKKLQTLWYKKLKAAGFEDAELNENDLKASSHRFIIGHNYVKESWEAKQEYYRLASHFLNDHVFEASLDKTIWEYHSNALSVRDIAIVLKKAGVLKMTKSSVLNVVQRLSDIMKERYLGNYGKQKSH